MKVLVTGGREYNKVAFLSDVLTQLHVKRPITLMIEGKATGADTLAWAWAEALGIEHSRFEAHWKRYGGNAGRVRNCRMLRESRPDLVVAFQGHKGTRHMVSIAEAAGVPCVLTWEPEALAKFLLGKA